MESLLAVISLASITLFSLSFFHSWRAFGASLDTATREKLTKRIRWVFGSMAVVSTSVFILYSISA